jgi:transcriptional regulator with XRE-family HTH domain
MSAVQTKTLGQFIREHRVTLQLRQEDVVEALVNRGQRRYNQTAIAAWELDRTLPPIHDPGFVRSLAAILQVSETEILRAAGFSVTQSSDLPPEIIERLKRATPSQLAKIAALLDLIIDDKSDQGQN